MDSTSERGRWANIQTTRIYVDGAAAETSEWRLTEKGERIAAKAKKVIKTALKTKALR